MIKQCVDCGKTFSTKDKLEQFCSDVCRKRYESKKSKNIVSVFIRNKIIQPIRRELDMDVISDTKIRKSGEMASSPVIPIEKMRGRPKKRITTRPISQIEKRIDQYRKASDPLARIQQLSKKLPKDEEEDTYIRITPIRKKRKKKRCQKLRKVGIQQHVCELLPFLFLLYFIF